MMHKRLPRRTFLRGLSASVALPMLDAMTPAFAAGSRLSKPACRMAFCYVPNGVVMSHFTPQTAGADFDCPSILEPLAAFRDRILVLSGLTQNGGRALGDGPGDHARAAASFLTGVHPKKTAGADIHNGISADQVAAQAVGGKTRFASLEIGCEDGRLVGNCDSGYSCAYSNSISWRSDTTPNPPEINPRAVFERLFGAGDGGDPATRARRARYNKSILDFVKEDTERLRVGLGQADQRKLEEYLSSVREIEKRIESAERHARQYNPPFEKPAGIPVDFQEHARLMFDLLLVAFQTDQTRIATLMLGREGSVRSYREIGISDAHHPLTHHRGNPDMIEKVRRINRHHMEQFAYFLGRLHATRDGDGTLLDHSMILYGSGLADGNRHTHNDLPAVLAGGANGALKPGRHIRYQEETRMTNLFLSMLDRLGVRPESIGDSNGRLEHLSELG